MFTNPNSTNTCPNQHHVLLEVFKDTATKKKRKKEKNVSARHSVLEQYTQTLLIIAIVKIISLLKKLQYSPMEISLAYA